MRQKLSVALSAIIVLGFGLLPATAIAAQAQTSNSSGNTQLCIDAPLYQYCLADAGYKSELYVTSSNLATEWYQTKNTKSYDGNTYGQWEDNAGHCMEYSGGTSGIGTAVADTCTASRDSQYWCTDCYGPDEALIMNLYATEKSGKLSWLWAYTFNNGIAGVANGSGHSAAQTNWAEVYLM